MSVWIATRFYRVTAACPDGGSFGSILLGVAFLVPGPFASAVLSWRFNVGGAGGALYRGCANQSTPRVRHLQLARRKTVC